MYIRISRSSRGEGPGPSGQAPWVLPKAWPPPMRATLVGRLDVKEWVARKMIVVYVQVKNLKCQFERGILNKETMRNYCQASRQVMLDPDLSGKIDE